jgi:phage tail tape-measure protein
MWGKSESVTFQEIVKPVVDQLLEETARTMPDIPADLKRTYSTPCAWSGAAAGMSSGAYFGAGLGIAGGPLGAIAGTIPGAIIGGIVGYFSGDKIGAQFEQDE